MGIDCHAFMVIWQLSEKNNESEKKRPVTGAFFVRITGPR